MKTKLDKLLAYSLSGGMPVAFMVLSLLLGAIALQFMAREEEPQIVVPMIDVLVESPGLAASQVERQVTIPLEKLLAQIPGVEHVYSTSMSGKASVTLRFYVGEDREDAILNTYNKLYANQDNMPGVVSNWLVKPIEVDDVAIVILAMWSDQPERSSDYELRRVADEVATHLQSIDNTSEIKVTGGRPRTIRILPQPESLAARQSTSLDIVYALQVSNILQSVGRWSFGSESILLESGDFIRSVAALKQTVINVIDGVPVTLQDVAEVIDGPAEPEHYTWIDFSENHLAYRVGQNQFPMVTISIAKQRGSNAVRVAEDVHAAMAKLKAQVLPDHIQVEVLRDYGATANEKVLGLGLSLAFAVLTVVVFIAVFLGWRPALVVGIAVPVSYGVTLALDMAFGYTINRVTLFALILSLGLLVDDPITGIDNIARFLGRKNLPGTKAEAASKSDRVVAAISEIKVPLLMSTVTIILAFIPLAFITGMMGPYMAPMAFNVPVSVITSTVVAFLVTPWLATRILRTSPEPAATDELRQEGKPLTRLYQSILRPFLENRRRAKCMLWLVMGLFIAAALLPVLRSVPLKLLPFDNKNELQVVVDMPESATLEQTASMAMTVSETIRRLNEVEVVASYVGVPSPIDFNGMVRHYYQRSAPYQADLRVTLIDKARRIHQSHAVVLRLRQLLQPLGVDGISLKVVEVPPGPPVLSTLVVEVSGSTLTPYQSLREAGMVVKERLEREAMVTEVDTSVEAEQSLLRFVIDSQKAALSGISSDDVRQTLQMTNPGHVAGYLQLEREAQPLPLELRLPLAERSSISDLQRLPVRGRAGIVQQQTRNGLEAASQPLVALGELGEFVSLPADKAIYRKDLKPVVYVMAELSGRTPAEVIADIAADQNKPPAEENDWRARNYLVPGAGDGWSVPDEIDLTWSGEGEWKITVEVFRDMGLAFLFALVGIFMVLKLQTASTSLTLIIMSAIPLTIIGIMPGFALLNQFGERQIAGAPDPVLFTATAMIGMIALAGIVVRNSLILVEFITQARDRGMEIKEALLQAGAVRMRPVLLTAGTTMLGNMVIILDPVFSGLALAILFGIVASTLFTLLVVPVVYLLVFENSEVKAQ